MEKPEKKYVELYKGSKAKANIRSYHEIFEQVMIQKYLWSKNILAKR